MCSCDEEHRITREQGNCTLEDESVIMSVLDRCERHQMWQRQTLAVVITTVSLETNGNHVPRSLIPEPSRAEGEAVGRCVRRKMIQYDNHAIRWRCRGRLTPGQRLLSELIAYNQRTTEKRHRNTQLHLYTLVLIISGLLLEINPHNVCWLYCLEFIMLLCRLTNIILFKSIKPLPWMHLLKF